MKQRPLYFVGVYWRLPTQYNILAAWIACTSLFCISLPNVALSGHATSMGAALTDGIKERVTADALARVTNVARTVANRFKFCKKIGLDVAVDALQESQRAKRLCMDDLSRYASLCRVANMMRSYMESLS